MNEIWFSVSRKERIFLWRKFRKSLLQVELPTALQMTADWWATAPLSANTIDVYDSNSWASPWDFIWAGNFDENSVALGMAYTLQLEELAECKLLLIQKKQGDVPRLVVLVDNYYVLNYNYKIVDHASVLKNCDILHTKAL